MVVTRTVPPRSDDIIGRKAGTYVIDRLIGEGGMGAVYTGTCVLAGNKRAAIKVMHGEYTQNREAAERFGREAVTAAAVKDLNVLDIYGADQFAEDGRMFIIMPFVEGGSLEDLCRRTGPMSVDAMIPIMLQVCSGLDAVHAVGVIHRDVKTQNILVSRLFGREYHVYIVDFGIAKLLATYLAGHAGNKEQLTRTRAAIGTPGCMAPEQARGDSSVDARADVYSVGMVMYRMLLGRMPYEAPSMFAMLEMQAQRAPFPRPRELRRDLPPIIDELIMSCLEHDKQRRPDSMLTIAQWLAKVSPAAERQFEVFATGLWTRRSATPQAATVASGVESAIARLSTGVRPDARPKRIGRIALPMVVGVAVGAGALTLVKLATDRHAPQTNAAVAQATEPTPVPDTGASRPASSPVTADAAAPAVASDTAAHVAVDAGVAETTGAGGSAHVSDAVAAPPKVTNSDAGVSIPTVRAQPKRPSGQSTPPPLSGTGTLVVRKPPRAFLEVYVGGKLLCETPCREPLDPGTVTVTLKGGGKEETTAVKINPGRETLVQRNDW